MKKQLILCLVAVLLITVSCNSNKSKVEQITKLEKELMSSRMTKLDTAKAAQLITLYDKFVNEFPKDTLSPVYLFRAADLNMAINRGNQSVVCLDKIINDYHDYSKVPDCMFLKAFVAENVMHNLALADQYYREFLKEFPTHKLAKDAEASLKNLGKSPEELVAEFEAKQDSIEKAK